MSKKLNEITKKVIYGATAAIAAMIPTKAETVALKNIEKSQQDLATVTSDKKTEMESLLLYRSNNVTSDNILFHTSHSSHSSHASHVSHYSGSTSTSTNKSDTTSEAKKTVKPANESNNQISNEPTLVKKFGSRQLEKGMDGTDVADLQELLFKKGYDIKVTAVYDDKTVAAIKKFQKSKNIDETGKMDILTLWHLQHEQK